MTDIETIVDRMSAAMREEWICPHRKVITKFFCTITRIFPFYFLVIVNDDRNQLLHSILKFIDKHIADAVSQWKLEFKANLFHLIFPKKCDSKRRDMSTLG